MRSKLTLTFAAIAVLFLATFSQASNCTAGIIDKAGVIRNTAVIKAAAVPLVNQGVDVRVVTVDHNTFVSNGSSLAGVETALEAACPNFIDVKTGTRKANMFVIMVAPTDRAKNIFLGSYYTGAFDIPSTYSALANSSFKAGQWEQGIANTLNGTGSRAVAYHQQVFAAQQRARVVPPPAQQRVYTQQPVYNAPPTNQNADTGMSGLAIFFIVVLVLGVIVTVLYFVFRTPKAEAYSTTTDSTYGPSPTSYSGGGGSGRRYAAAAPSTVVIHDSPRYDSSGNLITGMLIGEALSRNNQPTIINNNPAPVYSSDPSYVPASAPVVDAPDSTWDAPATQQADAPDTNFDTPVQSAPDTNFDTPSYEAPAETPSFDAPSFDPGPSNTDSGF